MNRYEQELYSHVQTLSKYRDISSLKIIQTNKWEVFIYFSKKNRYQIIFFTI